MAHDNVTGSTVATNDEDEGYSAAVDVPQASLSASDSLQSIASAWNSSENSIVGEFAFEALSLIGVSILNDQTEGFIHIFQSGSGDESQDWEMLLDDGQPLVVDVEPNFSLRIPREMNRRGVGL